jgi:hypothetical protein
MLAQSFMLMQSQTHFPACLKTPEGNMLAYGNAELSLEDRSLTFRSDFVPLYPLDTPLEVFRLDGNTPVHRFWGNVYLSDKRLMRLVHIDDELLPGSEMVYCGGLPFTGQATRCTMPLKKRHFFSRPVPQIAAPVHVAIPEMTDRQLVMLYDDDDVLEPGEQFLLCFDRPVPLPPIKVELIRSGIFALKQPRLCAFLGLKEGDRKNLREFLAIHNQKHHKLF